MCQIEQSELTPVPSISIMTNMSVLVRYYDRCTYVYWALRTWRRTESPFQSASFPSFSSMSFPYQMQKSGESPKCSNDESYLQICAVEIDDQLVLAHMKVLLDRNLVGHKLTLGPVIV
jgi:hypothetical protein